MSGPIPVTSYYFILKENMIPHKGFSFCGVGFILYRFWDLAYPERSYVVAGVSSSPSVSFYRKIIEGTEVVQVYCFILSFREPFSHISALPASI